ncbi:MAG TPA: cobalamin biosynthesis protein [Candidatus Nitrosopolaris sp.]|nr:cobalamin biosynthesis protein [Candidatus Nitrosopolaris sp.]
MMESGYGYLLIGLIGGVLIDIRFGDPPNKYHPVSWLGVLIGFFIPTIKVDRNGHNGDKEKLGGMIFAIVLIALLGVGTQFLVSMSLHLFGLVAAAILAALVLKIALAIKGMERHAIEIMNALERADIKKAQHNLSLIVRRQTKQLSRQDILSATIECIGESTVDGIVAPLFFYSILGPAGALAYRITNTLDSMVGYKDDYYKNIGWMSAKLDTIANYVPARITSLLMVIASRLLGADWKNSIQILRRDHSKTRSPNAGYPMATLAGALRIKLEKVGHYSLGENREPLSIAKCKMAISIMKLTTILFSFCLSIPTLLILDLVGWWKLLFGL